MTSIEKAVIARLRKSGLNFELLVDCEKAVGFKSGKNVSLNDVVVSDRIYKDSKKGFVASESDIKKVFNTTDFESVANKIIKEGEVQLTAEYRNKLREEKRRMVID